MDLMTVLRSQWDRLLAVACLLGGVVVLIIGWLGISGTAYPAAQMPYLISAGVGGLFLLGVSTALWLSADLRDEWRKLDRIEHAIRAAGFGDARFDSGTDLEQGVDPAREPEVARTERLPRVAVGNAG